MRISRGVGVRLTSQDIQVEIGGLHTIANVNNLYTTYMVEDELYDDTEQC